jgi:cytochrome b subunit of formate dehydrogenase
MYMKSTHFKKIADGAANCKDCHAPGDPHDLKDRTDPTSPIHKNNIASTCGNCHDGAVGPWRESVHGVAFLRGTPDAPTCTTCHGEHLNVPKGDPALTTGCANCHGSEKLASMYSFKGGKVAGYNMSFHGLAAKLGDRRVANCASCHGNHAVFPAADPRSSVNQANLAKTCGQEGCHPGVKNFAAMGNIHVDNEGEGALIKKIVKNVYIYLIIFGTIGGMLAHNMMDFYRKMKIRYAKRKKEQLYVRMNGTERLHHFVTLSTFITLVITGFSLKWQVNLFPWLDEAKGAVWRGWIHRGAAVLMIYGSLDHVRYILTTERGRDQFRRMLPVPKDAKDILHNLKFFLGIVDHPPRFARWTYIEKMEYLALLWGTIVMIATGFLLWFPTQALKHMPMWGIDVATLVHYYEAILATLAIIVWHWYTVFLNPDFAPMAFTWIDGNLTRAEMAHEHPLDLEEIEGKPLEDDHGHH